MFILPVYANRTDLTWFEKLAFSIDDLIKGSQCAHALYQHYFFSSPRTKEAVEQIWCNLGVIPLVLSGLHGVIVDIFSLDNPRLRGIVGVLLFATTVVVMEALLPYLGWGLLLLFLVFYLISWFFELMCGYDNELRKRLIQT
jgi:hypothetical protein